MKNILRDDLVCLTGWPQPEHQRAQHLPASSLSHPGPRDTRRIPSPHPHTSQRSPQVWPRLEEPLRDSLGRTDLIGSLVSSRGPGQPRWPESAQSKGWSRGKGLLVRGEQGLKCLLIQTGPALRNHFRVTEATVATILSLPKGCTWWRTSQLHRPGHIFSPSFTGSWVSGRAGAPPYREELRPWSHCSDSQSGCLPHPTQPLGTAPRRAHPATRS